VWTYHAPKAPLSPPSAEARRLLVVAGDPGEEGSTRGLAEYLRRDRNGKAMDARYALVGREQVYTTRYDEGYGGQQGGFQPWGWDDRRWGQRSSGGFFGGLFGSRDDDQWRWQQQQQVQRQRQYQYQQPQQPQYQQQYQQRRPSYPNYYQDRF
jgi:hypothetical protein